MNDAAIQVSPLLLAHSSLIIQRDHFKTHIWSCHASLLSPHSGHTGLATAPKHPGHSQLRASALAVPQTAPLPWVSTWLAASPSALCRSLLRARTRENLSSQPPESLSYTLSCFIFLHYHHRYLILYYIFIYLYVSLPNKNASSMQIGILLGFSTVSPVVMGQRLTWRKWSTHTC